MTTFATINKTLTIMFLIAVLALSYSTPAHAVTVTSLSDTLSDSRPTVLANHDIKFKMDAATTIANTETLAIKFTGFTVGVGTLVQADFAVNHDADGVGSYTALTPTTHYTIATVNAGADPVVTITFTTLGATAIDTDKYMEVVFTNGTTKLPNPSAGSYTVDIDQSTFGDTGQVQVAVFAGQTTTLAVSASLTVTISPVTASQAVNGATTSVETTATTFPFGTMVVNTDKIGALDIAVSTNAAEGYTTSIKWFGTGTNDGLTSGLNNCDAFTNGSATNADPKAWAAGTNPSGTGANVNTCWYGYTTNDATLGTGTAGRFTATGGDKWAPFDTTAYEVAYNSVPVNAETTRVGHKVEVNALQPMGSYTGVTEYITTAIFQISLAGKRLRSRYRFTVRATAFVP